MVGILELTDYWHKPMLITEIDASLSFDCGLLDRHFFIQLYQKFIK